MSHWHVVASLPHVTRLMSHCVRAGAAISLVAVLLAPLVCPQKVYAGEPFTIETIAGATSNNGFSGDGGPALDAEFYDPMGITRDSSGNMFIADFRNHRVRMIPARDGTFYGQSMTGGCVYTIAGTGTQGYTRDGFMGPTADLKYPNDVAVDGAGNVYLSDSGNHCIRMINATGIITTVAGYGSPVYSGDNIPATSARLNWPRGIWLDASDNLYIADEADHLIRMVPSTSGTYFGQAMTAGYIYSIAGKPVDSGYSGDGGTPTSAELNFPYSVYLDAHGHLYIGDANNHVVRMIPATTDTHYGIAMTAGYIYTIAGTGGSAGYDGDGGDATSAKMHSPHHMLVDVDGTLFVADNGNDCIRKVTTDGTISTCAGTGTAGFSGDGGQATEAQLYEPDGMFFDARGNLVFADSMNDRIRVVYAEINPWHTFLGSVNNDSANGVAVDGAGNVFVVGETNYDWDEEDPVREYSDGNVDAFVARLGPDGTLLWHTFLGGSPADYGLDIALDADGDIYVTGFSDGTWESPVRPISSSWDVFVAKLAGDDGSLVWNTFLGGNSDDRGYGIAVDADENVYVTGMSYLDWTDESPQREQSGGADAFAAKLNANGSLAWYTYLGGTGNEYGNWNGGIAVTDDGYVYVTSSSPSSWSEAAVEEHHGGDDAFVARLTSGGALDWHTFLGSAQSDSGNDIVIDGSGNALIAGQSGETWGTDPVRTFGGSLDAMVAKLDTTGNVVWHTFLGGSSDDGCYSIALDASGNVHVSGSSWANWGTPAQTHSGAWDMFAAKLSPNGALTWHSFAGSTGYEIGLAVDVGADNFAVVAGSGDGTWGEPVRAYSYYNDGLVVQLVIPTSTVVDIDLDLAAGWNMVSVPVVPADSSRAAVFPTADVVAVYTWNPGAKSFGVPDFIEPEVGYWVAVTEGKTITVTGTPVTPETWTVHLYEGWNMIGGPYSATAISKNDLYDGGAGALRSEYMYWWDPDGQYVDEDELEQGKGYWMAATGECDLVIQASS